MKSMRMHVKSFKVECSAGSVGRLDIELLLPGLQQAPDLTILNSGTLYMIDVDPSTLMPKPALVSSEQAAVAPLATGEDNAYQIEPERKFK